MISRGDIPHLRRASRSWRSALHVTKLLLRYGLQRMRAPRGTTLYLGNALVNPTSLRNVDSKICPLRF